VADKGYQGFENDANVGTWCIKKKKPKHQNLLAEQAEWSLSIHEQKLVTPPEFENTISFYSQLNRFIIKIFNR
jgi:hypothetical protein